MDGERSYHGPDAAARLAASKLDAVVIETPTYFHAEQAKLAVEAGKHVYVAKPLAVDVPGCRSILASGQRAREKKLTYWVDFQSRAREVYQETAKRIHRGDIGKPALAQVFYYAGRPWKDKGAPGMDEGQRTMANWFGDRVLSGDIIVEQNIHVIDIANWFLGGAPVKAYGTGGRSDWRGTPNDTGDAWDHFVVTYYYPNGVQATFSSHQLNGALAISARVVGVDSTADALRQIAPHRQQNVDGRGEGRYVQRRPSGMKSFIAAIRADMPIYHEESVRTPHRHLSRTATTIAKSPGKK